MTQRDLDLLFSAAREIPAQTSVEEVTAWVGTATATATGVLGIAAKLKLFIAKKSLLMLGSILGAAGITTVGILLHNPQIEEPQSSQVVVPQENVQEMHPEKIEIPAADLDLDLTVPESTTQPTAPPVPTATLAVRAPEFIAVVAPVAPGTLAPQIRVQPPKVAGIAPVNCSGDKDKNIKGSGNVITRTIEVQPFSKLEIGGIFDVYITQGNTESVQVEADDNLIDLVKVENVRDALVLNSECQSNVHRPFTMKIHVTVKNLNELNFTGIGDVHAEGSINGGQLLIENSGVGDVKLNLEYDKLKVVYSAVGNIVLSGNVKDVEMDCSGVGNVKAYDLKVQHLELNHNGVGNAEVQAVESLDIDFSGIGDVYYKGSPSKKNIQKNGIGNVKAR